MRVSALEMLAALSATAQLTPDLLANATRNFNAYLVAYASGEKSGDVDNSATFSIAY